MPDYYNEIDAFAAAWLRELIKAGEIPDGEVDERSVVDVRPEDLRGFTHCHFFAGIGGWAYALRLAGWPEDRPVWTGSCPCQPFSAAGKRGGYADARDLWPVWFRLIAECGPATVLGEQVAGKAGLDWLDLVFDDLESCGYAVAASDLPAASVGAPHIRQRLCFVAESENAKWRAGTARQDRTPGGAGSMGHTASGRCQEPPQRDGEAAQDSADRDSSWADAHRSDFWTPCAWLPCRDGKARPTQPGLFPLAHGVPARVGRLRGYGNAIVPQVAAAFVHAYLDATGR